jgi:hypothetical protein
MLAFAVSVCLQWSIMLKSEAIEIFGSVEELRAALGLQSRQAIYMWPDKLDVERTQRVIGAAIQAGVTVPKKFLPRAA